MMTRSDPIRSLVVDDHAGVRSGVIGFLSQCDGIDEADSVNQALAQIELHAPNVVVMDLIMPGIDGIEGTRLVKEKSPRSEVIILTSLHEKSKISAAFQAGAISYLSKSISPEELLDAIEKAAIGESVMSPDVAQALVHSFKEGNSAESVRMRNLTERENQVLCLIADGQTNLQIGKTLFISEKTVKTHVSNVLSKLHLNDRTQAAIFAWKNKLVS